MSPHTLSRALLTAALLLAACAAPAAQVPAPPAASIPARPADVVWTASRTGDPRVGTYVSKPWGFSTSSYWLEGPTGLVLVDTQFLPSAAEDFVDLAERTTGKKAVLAVVLHANPDKFNGTAVLQKRGVRVVTSRQVADLIPQVHALRASWFEKRYAPDYPTTQPQPEAFGAASTEIEAAGLKLQLHVLGAGCSEAHVALEWDGHLFVGDLVGNNSHAWLEIGKVAEWLQRLDELAARKPKFVHPGRGPAAGPELLVAQRAYLQQVLAFVRAAGPELPVDEAAVARVQQQLVERYPAHDYEVFLELGLPAVFAREAEAAAGKPK